MPVPREQPSSRFHSRHPSPAVPCAGVVKATDAWIPAFAGMMEEARGMTTIPAGYRRRWK